MKKMIFTMAVMTALVFSQGVNAQIELDYTFSEGGGIIQAQYDGGINYYVRNESSKYKLYNEDYSLYKTISITSPQNYVRYQVSFSKNIFTNDNKVAVLVCSKGNSAITDDNLRMNLILYDEDGTMIKDFGYYKEVRFNYSIHVTSDNKYRLSIYRELDYPYDNGTDIYTLPGNPATATGLRSAQVENTKQLPYPNPANTVITLPYKLEQGETSVMNIYNISGQLIDSKQIDYVFDRILLNVSGYAKGIYFYEVKGASSRFVVE